LHLGGKKLDYERKISLSPKRRSAIMPLARQASSNWFD
jgi:hypothetical protein